MEEYGRVKAHIADIELSARERADALNAATRERLQAMIAACRGQCEQVLSTLGATCESVSNELKRADAAVAQLPEAFTTLEGQLDELKSQSSDKGIKCVPDGNALLYDNLLYWSKMSVNSSRRSRRSSGASVRK